MNVNVNVTWKALEVRAEGSRRGFSKLGNDMKRTRPQFLPFYEARGMLPCTTEPRATAMAASRAQSHLALQRSMNFLICVLVFSFGNFLSVNFLICVLVRGPHRALTVHKEGRDRPLRRPHD